jgi:hypothetical protein
MIRPCSGGCDRTAGGRILCLPDTSTAKGAPFGEQEEPYLHNRLCRVASAAADRHAVTGHPSPGELADDNATVPGDIGTSRVSVVNTVRERSRSLKHIVPGRCGFNGSCPPEVDRAERRISRAPRLSPCRGPGGPAGRAGAQGRVDDGVAHRDEKGAQFGRGGGVELLLPSRGESVREGAVGGACAAGLFEDVLTAGCQAGQVLPVWAAVGGSPGSAVRAGRLGLPMALVMLGSHPGQFAPWFSCTDGHSTSSATRRSLSLSMSTASWRKPRSAPPTSTFPRTPKS